MRRGVGLGRSRGREYRQAPPTPQQSIPVRILVSTGLARRGWTRMERASAGERDPLGRAFAHGLADFLEALRVEAGLARNTLTAYRGDAARFLAFAAERGARRWEALA